MGKFSKGLGRGEYLGWVKLGVKIINIEFRVSYWFEKLNRR